MSHHEFDEAMARRLYPNAGGTDVEEDADELHPTQNGELVKGKFDIQQVLDEGPTELDLDWILSSDKTITQLQRMGQHLKQNRTLKSLWMKFNDINDDGIKYLAQGLAGNKTLTLLDLSRNDIGNEGFAALASTLKVNNTLRILNLGINDIEGETEALEEALKSNTGLTCLDLSQNSLRDEIGFCLGNALEINRTLTELNLSGNPRIIGPGLNALLETLKANQGLTSLDLSNIGLQDEEAICLGRALAFNISLITLELKCNDISATGMKRLAAGLKQNRTLEKLSLGKNPVMTEAGSKALAEALKTNTKLKVLDLRRTGLDGRGSSYLADALLKNVGLELLNLEDNTLDKSAIINMKHIVDLVEKDVAVLMNDPNNEARRLQMLRYQKVLEEGITRVPWNRSRLMFVGKGKSGKTQTVRSLLGETFCPHWDSTVGATVSESTAYRDPKSDSHWIKEEGKPLYSQAKMALARDTVRRTKYLKSLINPTAQSPFDVDWDKRILLDKRADEESSELDDMEELSAFSVRGDSTESRDTFFQVDEEPWNEVMANDNSKVNTKPVADIKKQYNESLEFLDIGDTELDPETVKQYDQSLMIDAEKHPEAIKISLWDFGGQEVFYTLQHVFLTESGVYAVVFDMCSILTSNLKDNALATLLYWLRSIRLHAPEAPVLLIGTMLDKITSVKSLKIIDGILRSMINSDFPQVVHNKEDDMIYYAIDNRLGQGINSLRLAVEKAVQTDENATDDVAFTWLMFLDRLLAQREINSYISFDEAEKIAHEEGIVKRSEVARSLELFHSKGSIVYFTGTAALEQLVVLNPQWLVDGISKLIRDKIVHTDLPKRLPPESQKRRRFSTKIFSKRRPVRAVSEPRQSNLLKSKDIADVGLADEFRRTYEYGLASIDFLEYIWTSKYASFFIDVMHKIMLMNKLGEETYFVPCLNREKFRSNGSFKTLNCCFFDFSDQSFLPYGLFQRVTCLIAELGRTYNKDSSVEPELYCDYFSAEIEPGLVIILRENSSDQSIIAFIQKDMHAQKIVAIVKAVLNKINDDVMKSRLQWTVLMKDRRSGILVPEAEAREQNLRPWFYDEEISNKDRQIPNGFLELFYDTDAQ